MHFNFFVRFFCMALVITTGLPGSALADNAVSSELKVCNISFLDQTSEPDRERIKSTLIKVLTEQYPVLFSTRFNDLIVKHTYSAFKMEPGSKLKSNFNIPSSQMLTVKENVWTNAAGGEESNFMTDFWETIPGIRGGQIFYREKIQQISQLVWRDLRHDILDDSPLIFFSKYVETRDFEYPYLLNMIQTIDENPYLKSVITQLIEELAINIDKWGIKLETTSMPVSGYTKRYRGNFALTMNMSSVKDGLLKAAPPLPYPSSAMGLLKSGSSTAANNLDFQKINSTLDQVRDLSQLPDIEDTLTRLNSYFMISREKMQSEAVWSSFYSEAGLWLKKKSLHSAEKTELIRSALGAFDHLTRYQRLLFIEQNALQSAGEAMSRLEGIISQSPTPENLTLSASLQRCRQRLASLNAALYGWSADGEFARGILSGFLDKEIDDFEMTPARKNAIRSKFQEMRQKLGLSDELLKLIKKNWI